MVNRVYVTEVKTKYLTYAGTSELRPLPHIGVFCE